MESQLNWEGLERLIRKAKRDNCRLLIRLDNMQICEEWGVKFYPEHDDDAHFYAYNSSLDAACRQLMDELESPKW